MKNKIDFEKEKPVFINDNTKWYIEKELQKKINREEADNLPTLKNLGCFIVKDKNIEDYVLIDNKQNTIHCCDYTFQGYEQIEAKINFLKIKQHFNETDKNI